MLSSWQCTWYLVFDIHEKKSSPLPRKNLLSYFTISLFSRYRSFPIHTSILHSSSLSQLQQSLANKNISDSNFPLIVAIRKLIFREKNFFFTPSFCIHVVEKIYTFFRRRKTITGKSKKEGEKKRWNLGAAFVYNNIIFFFSVVLSPFLALSLCLPSSLRNPKHRERSVFTYSPIGFTMLPLHTWKINFILWKWKRTI